MTAVLHAAGDALAMAGAMGWEILWGLILGFTLSALVDVLVSKAELQKLMPDASLPSITRASLLGAASSSCSYAAVAIARSIFRQGGDFIAAMAFQFAATNLVIELGVLMVVLMGWSFAAAEFVGGPLMIALLVLILRLVLRPHRLDAARRQAERGIAGRMEGHADMATMAKEGSWRRRLTSSDGWTAVSHFFVMNWDMLWKDIAAGLLISGTLGALVPRDFWQAAFFADDPRLAALWGPVIGPLIAVASFTCSIGNVPLAAVLWNSGISFGGVIAFIFGDLVILPIVNIYRKYYGWRMSLILFGVFYLAMILAALAVEGLFGVAGWIPETRSAHAGHTGISFNYTTVLNLAALALAGWLVLRFYRTGGPAMMRRMKRGDGRHDDHTGA